MTDREAFLDHLAAVSHRPRHALEAHPLQWRNQLPQTTLSDLDAGELVALAKSRSQAVHVDWQTTTTANLPQALDRWQASLDGPLLLPQDERFFALGLDRWAAGLKWPPCYWDAVAGRAVNLAAAKEAGGAIAMADYLIAESGTLTIATTPGQGRALHFLPPHYLAIVPQSHIVARSYQAMLHYQKAEFSNLNFITGPSNSGDIEMVLIVGVHGPLTVTYLVISDQ